MVTGGGWWKWSLIIVAMALMRIHFFDEVHDTNCLFVSSFVIPHCDHRHRRRAGPTIQLEHHHGRNRRRYLSLEGKSSTRLGRRRGKRLSVLNTVKADSGSDNHDNDDRPGQNNNSIIINNNKNNNKYNVSLLLIDHYDSFTYNLYDMLAQVTVEPPVVIAKDSPDLKNLTMNLLSSEQRRRRFDGVVMSPGPGWPHDQPSLPILQELVKNHPSIPVLGVCLGHQMLALTYGARVDNSPEPIHGQDHWIRLKNQKKEKKHDETKNLKQQLQEKQEEKATYVPPDIFEDLPSSFRVVRYHSLCAYMDDTGNEDEKIPLRVTARTVGRNNDNEVGLQRTQQSNALGSNSKDNDDHLTNDGSVIQAIQHVEHPHYGVQFHPESIGTQHGLELLQNFVEVVDKYKNIEKNTEEEAEETPTENNSNRDSEQKPTKGSSDNNTEQKPRFRAMVHKYTPSHSSEDSASDSYIPTPLQVFEKFYIEGGDRDNDENSDQATSSSLASQYAVWLDSSSYSTSERGTIDIIAAPSRHTDIIEHFSTMSASSSSCKGERDDTDIMSKLEAQLYGPSTDESGPTVYTSDVEWVVSRTGSEDQQASDAFQIIDGKDKKPKVGVEGRDDLPFHYRGGLIGYLGYEIRHETQRYLQEQQGVSETTNRESQSERQEETKTPAAAFFLARQSMLFHHPTQSWYFIALVEDDSQNDIEENLRWMKDVSGRLKSLEVESTEVPANRIGTPYQGAEGVEKKIEFTPSRSKSIYKRNIAECHEFIRMGESYELCLTNQLEADICAVDSTPFDLYRTLRMRNPAPYSAYFRWNSKEGQSREESGLVICSSSPEQFMSVTRQHPHPEIEPYLMAEAKPIKGTCARVIPQNGICRTDAESREDERRARSLELSLKNRAENLMIVDLLRNDLSRVCKIGSVRVSKLMDIESFTTVHQMVSTIRGTLAGTSTPIDLLRASFPGGSMTGAPKIRTMELLDDLEQGEPRGPYAGSLGYLSVNGCMSFNIVIRSAVLTPKRMPGGFGWHVSIGAGGAITALSEVQDEYDEMHLKARAVVSAVQEWAASSPTFSDKDADEFPTHSTQISSKNASISGRTSMI